MIEELQPGHLVYGAYGRTQTVRVDISELIVPKENVASQDPLNASYPAPQDFKYLLLQRGLAELRTPETASQLYRDAQERAKRERKGLWLGRLGTLAAPDTQSSSSGDTSPKLPDPLIGILLQGYGLASSHLLATITLLSTLGFTGYLASWVFENRNKRKVRLLILGEASAGKSAVCYRLFRPSATPNDILKMKPTRLKDELANRQFIQFGPLQIYPTYVDVPGPEYGIILDEFLSSKRPGIVLYVLATTMGEPTPSPVDADFINVQFGVLKAQLESVLKSNKVRKPSLIVLFINKFDLFSALSPEDANSSDERTKVIGLFKRHIENINLAAGHVPVKIVVGSALRNWNFTAVKEHIAESCGK